MTNKLTREFMQNIISGHGFGVAPSAVKAMAEYIVAAMDGEPVAWKYEEYVYVSGLGHLWREKLDCEFPGIDCGTLRDVEPLYRHAQQPVVPDESYQQLSELYHAQEKRLFKIAQRIKGPAFDKYSHSPSQAIDVLEGAIFGENDACRAAMLQGAENAEPRCGNSPVIPDGYVLVPKEPTRQMMSQGHFAMKGTDRGKFRRIYQAMIAAAQQELK